MKEALVKQALDDLENGYSLAHIKTRFNLLMQHYMQFGERQLADAVVSAWLEVLRLAPPSSKKVVATT